MKKIKTMEPEYFDIVDENGNVIGKATRPECHGNPLLIHRTVHVIVFHPDGRILLQKRRQDKDIQPGKWDSAVGGHLASGETYEQAAVRELEEELGVKISPEKIEYMGEMKIRNEIESENVRVYSILHNGKGLKFQKEEIEQIKFWEKNELCETLKRAPEIFTPNVILELKKFVF